MLFRALIPLFLLTVWFPAVADIPVRPLQVERLPDMSVPRSYHSLTVGADGSIYAFGGHTTGFVLTESAEVFRGGKWHALPPMYYPHNGGFCATLPDGSVMLGGGVASSFGVGQSLGVEVFHPSQNRFDPLGILPSKRALASAQAFPDGSVLVSGNWYAPDDLVRYTPGQGITFEKAVSEQRSLPYILPLADGDALILGGAGTYGEELKGWVDRLKGDAFLPALFEEYLPRVFLFFSADGNALGGGSFLIPLTRRSDGQVAFAHVQGTEFTLLETDHPVPMTFPDGSDVRWDRLLVDRQSRKAYMTGLGDSHGLLVLVLDYDPMLDGGVAKVSLLFAPEEEGPFPLESHPVLLRSGQIAMVGGRMEDNFHPVASAFILHAEDEDATARSGVPLGVWILLLLALAGAASGVYFARKRTSAPAAEPARPDLLSRIVLLMEERQFYLRKDIRIADVAAELGTNSTYISACLNGQLGKSFSDFVAEYRVRHAKELLAQHPDMSMVQVADESGFPSERSFYRHFKNLTGKTPAEWRGV